MSAWRRVAIEKIPRYRQRIEHAESVGMLWVDLWMEFVRAHSDPIDEELIRQIYDYASWCASSPDPDTGTSGVVSFYEHLPRHPEVRAQIARWLPAELFTGMGEVFRYHLSTYDEYKAFVQEFYEQRARLGNAAAKSEEEPLSPEEFQTQVSEAVTCLQEERRQRGHLSFEFLARVYILDNRDVMKHLAPLLQQRHGNAHALAAAITPSLLALVASGAVSFPADALTCAAAALLLSSRGLPSSPARRGSRVEGRPGKAGRRRRRQDGVSM